MTDPITCPVCGPIQEPCSHNIAGEQAFRIGACTPIYDFVSNEWSDLNDVIRIVNASAHGSWSWTRNARCKYIELRIDMRDGKCLIRNRDGLTITLGELQRQYGEDEKLDL